MHLLFLLSCVMAANAGRWGRRTVVPVIEDSRLEEIQSEFQSGLDQLIEEAGSRFEPRLQQLTSEMSQCTGSLKTAMNPCKQCMMMSCSELYEELEEMFNLPVPDKKRIFSSLSNNINSLYDTASSWVSSASSLGSNIASSVSDKVSSVSDKISAKFPSVADELSSVSNTVSNAATDAWGSISSGASKLWNKFGRRGLQPNLIRTEARECMQTCETCQPLLTNPTQFMSSVCGSNVFFKYITLSRRLKALARLEEINEESILERVEIVPSESSGPPRITVSVRLPATTISYTSNVPYNGKTDIGMQLAREYFIKYNEAPEY